MKQASQFERVSAMLYWLVEHQHEQPSLDSLAGEFGQSPHHLLRTFRDFVGVSPKQFIKYLTKEQALNRLRAGATVFDTSLDCGLSGPGRLHDLLVTTEAITPGAARRNAAGVSIRYGFAASPFGECLLAWTDRGLCFLGFCHDRSRQEAIEELSGQWRSASISPDDRAAQQMAENVFSRRRNEPLKVWLHGTPFQLKVWQALLRIPEGIHCNYGQIAAALGQPTAARAVGTAVGDNPISYLIPCHRVITSSAGLGGYRWGLNSKRALIGFEAAQAARQAAGDI